MNEAHDRPKGSVANDQPTKTLYARMRQHRETAALAATALAMDDADLGQARDGLLALGLLHPVTDTAVDPAAAFSRILSGGRSGLRSLTEQLHNLQASIDSLVADYLPLSHGAAESKHVELIGDRDRINQTIDELGEITRHDMMAMQPPPTLSMASLTQGLERYSALRARDIRIRNLYSQQSASDKGWRWAANAQTEMGVEIRLATLIPTRLIIFDRQNAIMQIDPRDYEFGAVLLRGGALVASLAAIFDYCWILASDLEDVPQSMASAHPSEQQQAIVRMLSSGLKDEAIARSLGTSTRTVTRLVSEIMSTLDARSRFQAGVRAAKLGWLD
ncbi:hypothetical protein GCM10022225_77900 [Plantactinospora mayteni]|uniref:HTH luxR-type domain-containing protein n=1 Tax=Plantactinospora mayteni TaxID=566021 RepID=A0ABQ4ERC8_9ACTN|nr:helix-turn-helix transcriptional regulator [Plantactinospora mayteni]GIG97231.1 hypothetical protein Pma05_38040 [Plantactinospora mayteni]